MRKILLTLAVLAGAATSAGAAQAAVAAPIARPIATSDQAAVITPVQYAAPEYVAPEQPGWRARRAFRRERREMRRHEWRQRHSFRRWERRHEY